MALCLCTQMTPPFIALNNALSELNSWCLGTLYPSFGKVRSYAFYKKTAHRVVNSATNGEDRNEWVKLAYSTFGRYY